MMRYSLLALGTLTTLGALGEVAVAAPEPAAIAVPTATVAAPTDTPTATPPSIAATPSISVEAVPEFSAPARETRGGRAPLPLDSDASDYAVRATDVRVVGASAELREIALNAVGTQAGGATSDRQLAADVAALLNTGLFASAEVARAASDSGLAITYQVEPVVARSLDLQNARVLTPEVAQQAFQAQLGEPASPAAIRQAIAQLNQWYEDNGYPLARVADARMQRDGTVQVAVAEGQLRSVDIRFFDEEGQPTDGRSHPEFLKAQLDLQPGDIFSVAAAEADLRRLYELGLFQVATIDLQGDANQTDLTYQLREIPARGVNVGGGYSETTGIFGTVSYNDRNLGGIGQDLDLNLQAGRRDLQFDGQFRNPYRASQPERPGYSVGAFRQRSTSSNFGADVRLADGDRPQEGRFGGNIALERPLDENWQAGVGLNVSRVSIRDQEGELAPSDRFGNPLSFSETGIDDLVTVQANLANDQRDNPRDPTGGSLLQLSSEQSVPVGSGSILNNRLNASYSQFAATNLLGQERPEVLALNVQAGTTVGDLPPYQAFNLGGSDSIRGYNFSEIGGGRSYALASAEYRVPILSTPLTGVVFADFGSDLGSSAPVQGENGEEVRQGSGFGYGAGLRLDSPVGIIRADLGFSDRGDSRLHFGLGHRF